MYEFAVFMCTMKKIKIAHKITKERLSQSLGPVLLCNAWSHDGHVIYFVLPVAHAHNLVK